VAGSLFRTKSIDRLLTEHEGGAITLKRTLGPAALVALGIGAVIGAGIFVRTAAAIAERSGPSVTIAFMIAGVGCAFAGLCYAEFASIIPIAGSAYTYSYATMGELVAWIIGWDLVLEYAVGAATVAIAWSEYFNRVLELFNVQVPYQWSHSPLEVMAGTGVHGVMNVPALFILLMLSLLLARGTQESAFVNTLIVITKVTIVMVVIVIGWGYINPAYHTPYIPPAGTYTTAEGITHDYGGIMGILGAAGVVFFAFIGFDAVSTAAQEAKNPKRDMPIGILGSLVVCTVLYVLFAHVLSGVAPVEFFRTAGQEASVAEAILQWGGHQQYAWLANFVSVAILAGFSSVILVMLLGQSRVFYSMSRDGLVPSVFSDLHPRHQTPYKSNMLFFVLTGLFGAFLPESIVGEMTSIGTLFAFILVCAGVWILRVRRPDIRRGFTVPALPVVAVLGIVVCGSMIYGLGWTNWLRLVVWLVIGLVFYFGYGRTHSRLEARPERVANVPRG
jgi:APA family basic amino acid/polyamine antiporter